MRTLRDLLNNQIRDLWSIEGQLLSLVSRATDATSQVDLIAVLALQRDLAREHRQRLNTAAETLDIGLGMQSSRSMEVVIAEGWRLLDGEFEGEGVREIALIGVLRRANALAVTEYRTAARQGERLGLGRVTSALESSLDEYLEIETALGRIAV